MNKINFQDGQKVSSAKVTIDEVDYPVTPARYNGATPLSSTVLNTMQNNIEDAIDQNADNIGGEDYDATSTYDVGDIVKYQGQLYICTTAITTAEAWNSNHWQETDVLSSAGGNEITIGSQSDITGKTKIFVEESTQKLKYKDSTTGQFEDIAGDEVFIGEEEDAPDTTKLLIEDDEIEQADVDYIDSIPINAVIEYDGDTVPDGYEEVDDVKEYEITLNYTSAQTLYQAFKNKNIATITGRFIIESITANTAILVGTLPDEMKPKVQVRAVITILDGSSGSAIGYGQVILYTNGEMRIATATSTTYAASIVFTITYLTN